MAAGAVACTWPRSIDSPRSPTSGVLRESEAHPTGDSPWTAPGSEHARRAVREGAPCAVGFFQLQNSRKPRRCDVTTVSGVTMCTAVRQPRQACANHAHRRRSTNVRRRRGRRDRLMTASWCRRAMISRCSGEPRLGGQIGASRAAKRRRMTRLQAIGECPQPQSMQHVRSSR